MSLIIIEDCSPFYIRFTHPELDKVVDFCKQKMPTNIEQLELFTHHKLSLEDANTVLGLIPFSNQFPFLKDRVSLFISKPGLNYRAHKDGLRNKISWNYTVIVLDDKCVTKWYSDYEIESNYKIVGAHGATSREAEGFDASKHESVQSMTAKPNECILFNTDLYHGFDNRESKNIRAILTLRVPDNNRYSIDFLQARKIMFGY